MSSSSGTVRVVLKPGEAAAEARFDCQQCATEVRVELPRAAGFVSGVPCPTCGTRYRVAFARVQRERSS